MSEQLEQGVIVNVSEVVAGDELTVDASAGATSLQLGDAVDFDETGGTLTVGDEAHEYVSADLDTDVITLAMPLSAAWAAGEPVRPFPESRTRVATVQLDVDGEAIDARVPHALFDKIAEGVRESGEHVTLTLDGSEYVISDVIGRVPVVDGSLIDPETLPATPTATDNLPPAVAPLLSLAGGVDALFASWSEVDNADPVTYRLHVRASAQPTIDGTYEVAAGVGVTSATVSVLSDGTPLQQGVTYFAIVVPEDADGIGPDSTPQSASLRHVVSNDLDPALAQQIDEGGGTVIYRQPLPPATANVGDEWHDTDNGNLAHSWDGSDWVPFPIGAEGASLDIVAGKVIPVNEVSELGWGVPDPQSAPYDIVTDLMYVDMPPALDESYREGDACLRAGVWHSIGTIKTDVFSYFIETWADGASSRTRYELTTPPAPPDLTNLMQLNIVASSTELFVLYRVGKLISVYDHSGVFKRSFTHPGYSTSTAIGLDYDGALLFWDTQSLQRRSASDFSLIETLWTLSSSQYHGGTLDVGVFDFADGIERVIFKTGEVYDRATGTRRTAETIDTDGHSLTWDSATSRFYGRTTLSWGDQRKYLGMDAGFIFGTTRTSKSYEVTYSLADTDATAGLGVHETAAAPTTTVDVPARHALKVILPRLPVADEGDVDFPNDWHIYLREAGSSAALTRQESVVDTEDAQWYLPQSRWPGGARAVFPEDMTTTGAAAPTSSTFPVVGEAGVWRSEYGGLELRGDGTGAWPYFEQTLRVKNDSRYAPADHDHTDYATAAHTHAAYATATDLNNEITNRSNADQALDSRVDALEAGHTHADYESSLTALDGRLDALETATTALELTPTMSGVAGHAFYVKQIAPGVVAVSGYLDVDDSNTTRRDTGMRLPEGMRPLSENIVAFPQYGGSGSYRYFFGSDGVIEFQQSAGNNGPFEGVVAIFFTV